MNILSNKNYKFYGGLSMFEEYNKVQKAVLETTLELISEKELQATSMSLISKVSGISTGSIYHYFDNKEAIINELYKGIIKFHSETKTMHIRNLPPYLCMVLDFIQRFYAFCNGYFLFLL